MRESPRTGTRHGEGDPDAGAELAPWEMAQAFGCGCAKFKRASHHSRPHPKSGSGSMNWGTELATAGTGDILAGLIGSIAMCFETLRNLNDLCCSFRVFKAISAHASMYQSSR
jgi:hypothetical protein